MNIDSSILDQASFENEINRYNVGIFTEAHNIVRLALESIAEKFQLSPSFLDAMLSFHKISGHLIIYINWPPEFDSFDDKLKGLYVSPSGWVFLKPDNSLTSEN